MRLRILSPAQREIAGALERFQQYSDASARSFANALDRAFNLISDSPAIGSPLEDGARRLVIQGYRYTVVYRLSESDIVVIAIAHTSREQGYWRGRR